MSSTLAYVKRPAFRAVPAEEPRFLEDSRFLQEPQFLHEFFEHHVQSRPLHPALECGGEAFSYVALDGLANRFARYLRKRGVKTGQIVALCLPKRPELFITLLGVLKAGAAYAPIDPKFPPDRIAAIIDDAEAALLVTNRALASRLSGRPAEIALVVEDHARSIGRQPPHPAQVEKDDEACGRLCYAIFTSGSTGQPKGVAIEHRQAAAFVRCLKGCYGVTANDRVYQGFSLAFDAAVEELWMAWSVGGTLVVAGEETARSPIDAAQFVTRRCITTLSTVPTFLAMINVELPSVRLLIVGGEACPADLVGRWARGRRMLNTYGPTEAAVVATMSELKPGQPVTIGAALPGYYVRVLDENLHQARPGETGELYIGGAGVARGYIKRPELTAERFIADPFPAPDGGSGRLYRTFDHVRLLPSGELEYLGRLDAQIKIRGFRVELAEIEAVLLDHPQVKAAAVKVVGEGERKEIAAFVIPEGGGDLDRSEITALLRSRLPDYMAPKYLDLVDDLPLMTSGKIDRNALPQPVMLLGANCAFIPPDTPLERLVAAAWEEALDVSPISVEADFFLELGGHSLAAANAVSILRQKLDARGVTVRELYRHATIRKLASHLEAQGAAARLDEDGGALSAATEAPAPPQARALLPLWRRYATVLLQVVGIYLYYSVILAPFVFAFIILKLMAAGEIDEGVALNTIFTFGFLAWPSVFFLSVAIKWLVIGRYKPGRYPLWGWYYFRWWLATRFQPLSLSHVFVGTPLMTLYYRLMGAKVGRRCHIGTALCTAFDVVSIGDDASIGVETQLLGCRVEDGEFVIGSVDIGSRCFVGMHCALGLGVAMADDFRLDDMSLLADGEAIGAGECRRGSPAAPVESVEAPEPQGERRRHPILFGLIHLILIYAMGYFLILTMIPAAALIIVAYQLWGSLAAVAAAFASAPLSVLWYILCAATLKWNFIGQVRPGTFHVESVAYLRYWFLSYLLNNSRQFLLPLYATCYCPAFLRLMGARVGRRAEVSTVLQMTPDLVEIGEGSFCADACLIGGDRVHRGVVSIRPVKIGKRSFIGNSALAPGGADIGDNCLIGVMSTPPHGLTGAVHDTRWLGLPGFELPRTQQDVVFDERSTFRPRARLVALRAVVDALRVFLPGVAMMGALLMFIAWLTFAWAVLPLWAMLASAPAAAMAISWMAIRFAARVKKILIGTFKPTAKPLYSPFVWLNEVVNAVYEAVAAPAMEPLLGTPFVCAALRQMGCRIGRWVYLDTTLFSEFDLVHIDDYAALNLGATIQTHLFEDRIIKAAALHVGPHCSVGNMAIILYDARMQEGSWLGPLSVLMKGETTPPWSRWQGVPTEPAPHPASAQRRFPETRG